MDKAEVIGIARHRILRDGKGIITLIGIKGCPLKCRYCINKEYLKPESSSTRLSAKELYDMVRKDDIYYQATKGGITFGGGESLLHVRFIKEFKELCNSTWRINAETSLNVNPDIMEDAVGTIDHFIVDIKSMNPEIYRSYTGMGNEQVIANLKLLMTYGLQDRATVKIPLIPGCNDSKDIKESIRTIKNMGFKDITLQKYITDNKIPRGRKSDAYGKKICELLKHVRKTVAEANGFDWTQEECPNKVCIGICPKCEEDLNKLTERIHSLTNPIL